MSRCKCPKPDVEPTEHCSPYFEDITTRMEERRCDLMGRQKYLRDKITTMERSIPALMAFNMWMAKEKCEDAPYCKVREIMKKFSPYPDQTEKLLTSLKKTVKDLNGETAELHEKIIQAEVKLEETDMELESLELANKEMNDSLNSLEKEVQSYRSPSLHSIHSEDLLCLSKIRQLAEEELSLKNCIKELEYKETVFKEHMDRLLMSREYQNVCGRRKAVSCLQDLGCSGKRICCVPKKCLWHKPNGHRPKKMLGGEENDVARSDAVVSTSDHNVNDKGDQANKQVISEVKVEKRSSWMPNWWKSNQPTEEVSSTKNEETTTLPSIDSNEIEKSSAPEVSTSSNLDKELKEKKVVNDKASKSRKTGHSTASCKPCGHPVCPPPSSMKSAQHTRSCVVAADCRTAMKKLCAGKYILPCDIPCNKLFKALSNCKEPSLRKGFCELPRCATTDHGIRKACKPLMLPCDPSPCEICPSTSCKNYLWPMGNCRCNCRGKCARGLSDAECNCSDAPLDPSEEYQPTASKQLSDSRAENSNSEDEYCECCSCGCEDSDASASCQCN